MRVVIGDRNNSPESSVTITQITAQLRVEVVCMCASANNDTTLKRVLESKEEYERPEQGSMRLKTSRVGSTVKKNHIH